MPDLLKLPVFQVGSKVLLNELATQVRLDVKTVGRYLDIMEKGFVIVRIGGFSRNLRNEVPSKASYYFLDNGVRNAVISQYNGLDARNDIGALWENFPVSERIKMRGYTGIYGSYYFWRTYAGQEVDYLEERDGRLFGLNSNGRTTGGSSLPRTGWRHTLRQPGRRLRRKDSISLELRTARYAQIESTGIIRALSGTVRQAQRLLQMSEKGFEYGVKTRLEVDDAQTSLLRAESNLLRAMRDHLAAKVTM